MSIAFLLNVGNFEMSSEEDSGHSDTASDDSSIIFHQAGAAAVLAAFASHLYAPMINLPTPLPHVIGRQWVELNMRDFRKCHDNFRMTPDSFIELHDTLVRYHMLSPTQEVESCESLGMFLWACGTQQATHQIRDRFERSLDTISRKMAMVAVAMYGFAQTIICLKDPTFSKVHNKLRPYAPFFDGCIGALDGTHIPGHVCHESRLERINIKGWPSYNVLGIVDMDMWFTFVGVGLPGSCHDMAVLKSCMGEVNYRHPPAGMVACMLCWHCIHCIHVLRSSKSFSDFICLCIGRYYLVDVGYSICEGYLPPYRNQRHHLEDFIRTGVETVQEEFNFHHSSLRNVVEHAFGLLKSRWHVLRGLPFYERSMQVKIIIAWHNYLLDRGHIGGSGSSSHGQADYDMSD
jgi:hypothetical protein